MHNTAETTESSTEMIPATRSYLDSRVPSPLHVTTPRTRTPFGHLEIPFVHRKLIIGSILTAMLLGWIALVVWPRDYESEAMLVIRVGRESVALDPTATASSAGQTLLIQKTRMEEVVSALGVLDSRKVMETVVEELGAKSVLDGHLPDQADREESALKKWCKARVKSARTVVRNVLVGSGIQDRISDREKAVRELEKSVKFFSPPESAVVTIKGNAASPGMAQAIVASTTKAFVENHMQVSRTPGATKFFTEEAGELEEKLNTLVARRTDFMKENDLMSVDANRLILQTEVVAISTDLAEAKGLLEQAEAELAKTHASRTRLPATIVASSLERQNENYNGMRQKLFDLEAREQRLKVSLTSGHPLRAVVAEEIDELRGIVDQEQPTTLDENTTPNPELQRIDAVIQDLHTKIAGLNSLVEKKRGQLDKKSHAVEKLLSHEKQLISMDRDIKVLTSSLDSLKIKLQDSRVIDNMGRNHISNVSVFQPATLMERPVSPNKPIVGTFALAFGSLLGLAWAFMREGASDVLRTQDHLRDIARATPIYSIEKLRTVNARQNGRALQREAPKSLKHACRHILADFLLSEEWGEQRRLGVLSYERGNGASTLARELALACSGDCGIATTLIDTDLEDQKAAKAFGAKSRVSIDDFIGGQASPDDMLEYGDKLQVIPLKSTHGETQLNGSLEGLITRLKNINDHGDHDRKNQVAIVDLSPVRDFPEAAALARTLDSIVLVIESEKTTASEVSKLLRYLEGGDARVLCFVLNKTRRHVPRWLQKALGQAS